MRRRCLALALTLLVAGCGVRPSGPAGMGEAPTGVASGVTLYFVDARGRLTPRLHDTGRLGTVAEALELLLGASATVGDGLHSEIEISGATRVVTTAEPGLIHLRLPLADYEVTPLGIDQIVCTALGVAVQRGESRATRVRLLLTRSTPELEGDRSCPLIG
ncbi:hypothetical protein [Catenuloplanes atrovinosus]|uniref:GerMN domain-containing protein n=1 Tax=Catenuloplanes atrovinosus TaxID=137266 RepID=A0AAE3YLI6_9ACTN|nr:hypothetical protein [Catenuloplanes atrovinosus]MDR7275720.1 hypothetical protein [Catenuloplanes atrovinosus]